MSKSCIVFLWNSIPAPRHLTGFIAFWYVPKVITNENCDLSVLRDDKRSIDEFYPASSHFFLPFAGPPLERSQQSKDTAVGCVVASRRDSGQRQHDKISRECRHQRPCSHSMAVVVYPLAGWDKCQKSICESCSILMHPSDCMLVFYPRARNALKSIPWTNLERRSKQLSYQLYSTAPPSPKLTSGIDVWKLKCSFLPSQMQINLPGNRRSYRDIWLSRLTIALWTLTYLRIHFAET